MFKDIISSAYLSLTEASLKDSTFGEDLEYHIFDSDEHDAARTQFKKDKTFDDEKT